MRQRYGFSARSASLMLAFTLACSIPAFASPHVRRGPTAPHAARVHAVRVSARPATVTRPAGIGAERATQIQAALIKAGYLTGTPSGAWDSQSQAAMEKMQGDNGWQTKLVPDSRAIIKLGLGPNSTPAAPALPAAVEAASPAPVADAASHTTNQ